ncbi:MAG TPA: beta-CASP ribonuclease aCPSF1 [Nitrososphaeraceae archaeon]|nr:beta-CASP ribonuclease aCPSF1 [Nitrososphaeraceae archaeon]
MQRKPPYHESASQNIMAVILNSLPNESGLTKVEYEGPRIALYSKNPSYLIQNTQIVFNMVNAIKKRIVIRTDESIRKSEEESIRILDKVIPKEIGITDTFFDQALGEAVIFVEKPSLLTNISEDFENVDLLEKTGWKIRITKAPQIMSTIKNINKILCNSVNERIHFYKEVGEKIFRSKLNGITEASLITLGGFAEVGRSSMLLSTHESKILLDCGINIAAKDSLNTLPRFDITGLEINEIDAIVLSHAHLDHTGFLPALFKYGYRGPVYCSEPTLPLMNLLQKEYVKNTSGTALYSDKDIDEVIIHTIPLTFGIVTDISPDVKLVLSNSGHILGSASIHLHIGNGDHNVVYTGDMKFGRMFSLENASWNFPRVETMIIESTHGGKEDVFPQREEADARLIDSINKTTAENGKVLIPVPTVGLSQEIILSINMHMRTGKIVETKVLIEKIISNASSIHETYPQYLSKELKYMILRDEENPFRSKQFVIIESQSLRTEEPAIILAPSSMLTGGPSVEYLKQISEDPKSTLVLTSFQAAGTPGKNIQDGSREVLINDHNIKINCQVEKIEGFSNHSDYNQLVAYINRLRPKLRRVLVNHGERTKVQNLASSLNRMFKIQTQHPLVQEAIKLL